MTPAERRHGLLHRFLCRLLLAGLFVAIMVPLFFHLLGVHDYGRMQRDDYYGLLLRLSDEHAFVDTPASYFEARFNVHRVMLPALLYRANYSLTAGDNRVSGLMALGMVMAILMLLLRQVPASYVAFPPIDRLLASGWLALLVLGPHISYNLAKSFGGLHSYLADLFCVAAMACFMSSWRYRFLAIGVLGVLGILSFSSALALWPALIVGWLWRRDSHRHGVYLAVAALLSVGVFLIGFSSSGAEPTLRQIVTFFFVFLGTLPRYGFQASLVVGVVVVAALLATLVQIWRRGEIQRRHAVFWAMLAIYALTNAALAALGRGHQVELHAQATRYYLYVAYAWSALFVLATLALHRGTTPIERRAMMRRLAMVLIASFFAATLYRHGIHTALTLRQQGLWQQVVETQLRHLAWDKKLLAHTVSIHADGVVGRRRLALLRRLEHVPFDRPPELPRGQLDPSRQSMPADGVISEIFATVHPNIVRVGGWLDGPDDISDIVLADATGAVRSIIHWVPSDSPARRRWAGLAMWDDDWRRFLPIAVAEDGSLHVLASTPQVRASWQKIAQARRQ